MAGRARRRPHGRGRLAGRLRPGEVPARGGRRRRRGQVGAHHPVHPGAWSGPAGGAGAAAGGGSRYLWRGGCRDPAPEARRGPGASWGGGGGAGGALPSALRPWRRAPACPAPCSASGESGFSGMCPGGRSWQGGKRRSTLSLRSGPSLPGGCAAAPGFLPRGWVSGRRVRGCSHSHWAFSRCGRLLHRRCDRGSNLAAAPRGLRVSPRTLSPSCRLRAVCFSLCVFVLFF